MVVCVGFTLCSLQSRELGMLINGQDPSHVEQLVRPGLVEGRSRGFDGLNLGHRA